MLKLRFDDKIYIVELLLMWLICRNIMLDRGDIVSTCFKLTFIILVFGLLLQLYYRPVLNDLHLLAFAVVILSGVHVVGRCDVLSFEYLKKWIMFSCTVLMFPFVDSMAVGKRLANWILGINLCIALLYPLAYFVWDIRHHLGINLTMNFSNPNLTAMYIMHSLLYCFVSVYYFRSVIFRIGIVLLVAALVWLDWQTGARSTYVALAFFAVMTVLNIVLKKDVKISRGISFLIVILPMVLSLGYLVAYESGLVDYLFSFMEGEGKPLDTRVEIWVDALADYRMHPIFGAYKEISDGSGMSQMHNTHIDVLSSYGTVPFLGFVALVDRAVARILPFARTSFSRMCAYAFYAVLIQGSFEAAFVSGGAGLYIMSFGFLVLAKSTSEHTESRKRGKQVER